MKSPLFRHMNRKQAFLTTCIVIAIGASTMGWAQPRNLVPSNQESIGRRSQVLEASRKAWVSDPWTANDTSYVAAREQVKKRLAGQLTAKQVDRIVASYAEEAKNDWRDPVRQYSWATAALESARIYEGRTYQYITPAYNNLRDVPSPKSYEFTRLRYMLAEFMNEVGTDLRPLGRRLLRKNPLDKSVIYYYLDSLRIQDVSGRREARKWLAVYVKHFGDDPSTAYMAGRTYYKIWLVGGKKKADGDSTISYFQKYLTMIKTDKRHHVDDWGTKWVESKIARVRKETVQN